MQNVKRSARTAWTVPGMAAAPIDETHHHVIVVGGGIGGLSVAGLLAARGYRVMVFESHNLPGGNCTSWRRVVERDGERLRFVFDAGVQDFSGLGARGPLRNLLSRLDAEDAIRWHRVRHLYCRNGVRLEGDADPEVFIANIVRLFPREEPGVRAFFAEVRAVYREMYADVERTGGVPAPPAAHEMLVWPQTHPHAYRWMRQRFDEMLDTFLGDTELKQFLRLVSEYVTEDPHVLRTGEMVPLFGYYFDGGCYPEGGAQRFANLLAKCVRRNGAVRFATKIDRILLDEGRAVGVETAGGERHFAPVVISNADVAKTLLGLVGTAVLPEPYARKITDLPRGPSAVLLSLGLDTVMPLPARIFIEQNGLRFGVGNPSVLDANLAPPGCSAVTALCLMSEAEATDWLRRPQECAARKTAAAEALIDAIADAVFPDVRRHILYREVAAPGTFARFTDAANGNIYGAARGGWSPSLRSPVSGLLLVGAGTETGPGIEAVVVSATRAADLIADEGGPVRSAG